MDQSPITPDVAYRLIVTKKELAGSDNMVLTAVAPSTDPNNLLAQFSGVVPRSLVRGIELEDQVELLLVLRPKAHGENVVSLDEKRKPEDEAPPAESAAA